MEILNLTSGPLYVLCSSLSDTCVYVYVSTIIVFMSDALESCINEHYHAPNSHLCIFFPCLINV